MSTSDVQARRAKIVATLGPATDGLEHELVAAGLDVARLNFSHGEPRDHARRCQAIREAATAEGRSVAVMQDLQGPRIRVGRLEGGGPVLLERGRTLRITSEDIVGTAERISSTYEALPRDVRPGDRVLMDDGRFRLTVTGVEGHDVLTRVEEGGPLGEHKGINLPGVAITSAALTAKDRDDLRFGLLELDVDYVALSFVRTAADLRDARNIAHQLGCDVPLIAKLEKAEAIEELDAIMNVADGVMVARGDLGVELAPERVPVLQKQIVERANRQGIPVITATQMLESMIVEESPTRAEATDVANAVWDGTDAVMLSGETAIGQHPPLVIRMMDRIVRAAESAQLPSRGARAQAEPAADRSAAVAHAARVLAHDIGARAILGVTGSGRTAELLSQGAASVPVYAFSADERVCRRLALWWGITPIHRAIASDFEVRIRDMESYLLACGALHAEDVVVVTGVHPYAPGVRTNFVKYEEIGAALRPPEKEAEAGSGAPQENGPPDRT